jgi:hypothetical protein
MEAACARLQRGADQRLKLSASPGPLRPLFKKTLDLGK